jgi:Zn-dependent metalloprotease
LVYENQPGALNEHFSDVFGSLVKQKVKGHTAAEADWIVGEGLFTEKVNGVGIRSMKAPGTAYDDPLLGKDPQPGHMDDFVVTTSDHGGVHINSGIPNRAFYLAATALGGNAWEKAGMIWYVTLRDKLRANSDFAEAVRMTIATAGQLYGVDGPEQEAVRQAWESVGLSIPAEEAEQEGCRQTIRRTLGL